ncbi:MAG TPA: hypothetical protein VFV19_19435 [Candidatus Polarisedimenticolaceae bacterium]|nr:hypothetical protein [Candidatus Polarisedimenticolaceae bacterium]
MRLIGIGLVAFAISVAPALALSPDDAKAAASKFATLAGASKFEEAAQLLVGDDAANVKFLKGYWGKVTDAAGAFVAAHQAEVKGPDAQRKVRIDLEFQSGSHYMILEFTDDKISKFTVMDLL